MMLFGASGDALLSRGMKQSGSIDVHHLGDLFSVISNPYVLLGIVALLAFMWSYMTALSFADLSFVMPATAASYVLMTLLSIFWLHEHVGQGRWSGILFIVIGVGLVAGEPWRTGDPPAAIAGPDAEEQIENVRDASNGDEIKIGTNEAGIGGAKVDGAREGR